PQVGFLERTDCVCDFADATFKARPEFAGVREMQFEGFIFHAPDTHGVVQTQEWQTTFRADFHNGSYTDDDIVDVFAQRLTLPFKQERQHSSRRLQLDQAPAHLWHSPRPSAECTAFRAFRELLQWKAERVP